MARGGGQKRAICALEVHGAGHGFDASDQQICAGVNSHHPRHVFSLLGVESRDLGVGVGGAQEHQMHLPRQANVVGVDTCAQQELLVF